MRWRHFVKALKIAPNDLPALEGAAQIEYEERERGGGTPVAACVAPAARGSR